MKASTLAFKSKAPTALAGPSGPSGQATVHASDEKKQRQTFEEDRADAGIKVPHIQLGAQPGIMKHQPIKWVIALFAWLRILEALKTFHMTIIQLLIGAIVGRFIIPVLPLPSNVASDAISIMCLHTLSDPKTCMPCISDTEPAAELDTSGACDQALHLLSNTELVREDHASSSAGGVVVEFLTSSAPPRSYLSHFWAFDAHPKPPLPSAVLDSAIIQGQCWHVYSPSSFLSIVFKYPLLITHITIDHHMASPEDMPRHVVVWGLLEANGGHFSNNLLENGSDEEFLPSPAILAALKSKFQPAQLVKILDFEFQAPSTSTSVQTFAIEQAFTGVDFGVVVLEFQDNWGAPHTCIY
ncbi:hypothetical protein HGRIS_014826 [Hohenbuehelia grisea]|uniref:SUN domain-containing protein n=1 Tax=Hohenbuehelia grisea TaxID=104357 RepID=A0ABR3IQX3_9AGAR